MLALHGVHVSFSTRSVLCGVSCTFDGGRITGLIGDNGAGKTTLLRTAATVLPPDRGAVSLNGRTLRHQDVGRRKVIGALIETPGHYDELTVRENLACFYSFHTTERDANRSAIAYGLKRFDLDAVADERVGALSTGYRQRVAVARAFHPHARIALLDEPLAGLDPTTRSRLKETLRHLADGGAAICLSSHGLSDLDTLCDRLYVLARGKLHPFEHFDQIRERVGAPRHLDLDLVYSRLISELHRETES